MPLSHPLRQPVVVVVSTALAAAGLAGAVPSTAGAADSQELSSVSSSLVDAGGEQSLPLGVLTGASRVPGAALQGAPRAAAAAPPTAALTAAPVSRFSVTYVAEGGRAWTPAAKAAFEAALSVWSHTVESSVPIVVEATAKQLPPGALGAAGPADVLRNERGTPTREGDPLARAEASLADDVFEPLALFNARTRRDAAPGQPDIVAQFDPSQSFLYFGLDGRPGPEQYDFRSIVLHEIGHGLGIVGSGEVTAAGRATIGLPGANGNAAVRAPLAFDEHTYTTTPQQAGNGGRRLLDLPNGSAELRTALTGEQLYWAGQLARTAAGGNEVRLFAPSQCGQVGLERPCRAGESAFQPASSYGHLDERTYPAGSPETLMTPVLDNGESVAAPGQIALGLLSDMGYAVPALTGSRYTALDPVRLLDSREGVGGPRRAAGPGGTLDLQVGGVGGVPAGATAVVLNVTGVAPSADTDIRVYPTPVTLTPVPEVSSVNLLRGRTRANLVTVPLGHDGRVRLRNAAGNVGLVADLAGFYAPTAASTFTPVDPVRVLDTRAAVGTTTRTRVPAGGLVDLRVSGAGTPVPAGATAVALTVTAVSGTQASDVRVYPATGDVAAVPGTSSLNVQRGAAVPNVVVVKVGENGTVRLRNAAGEVHLLADLAGYYDGDAAGSLFRPVSPTRVLDTRTRLGQPAGSPTRVGAGQVIDLRVGGVFQVPLGARAAVLNVTGVGASAVTDVRVFPGTATTVPVVSNLNLTRGQTAADQVLVKLGQGRVKLRNAAGTVGLVADVSGWFGPAA